MVNGMESFVYKFRDYSDCYTIICGAACDILMTEADTEFRATRDIDMILIMEARYREFVKVFWTKSPARRAIWSKLKRKQNQQLPTSLPWKTIRCMMSRAVCIT